MECLGDAMLVYGNNRLIDENGDSLGKTLFDVFKGKMIQGDRGIFFFAIPYLVIRCCFVKIFCLFQIILLLRHMSKLVNSIAFAAKEGGIKYVNEVLVDWRQHVHSFTADAQKENSLGRKKRLKTEEANLNLFSSVPGEYQDFFLSAKKSWSAWRNSYIDFSMFIFVLRHENNA